MLFILNTRLANELAGVADAASTNSQRPVLARVQLGIAQIGDEFMLRAVSTDSHILAKREITVKPSMRPCVVKDDTDEKVMESPVLVDAKRFKKALKDVVAERAAMDSVLIDIEPEAVTIARESSTAPELRLVTSGPNDGQYPQWAQLIKPRVPSGELTLPAFNATLLRRMEQTLSAKPSDRANFPVRLCATEGHGDVAGRPWVFHSFHTEAWYRSEIEVLVMPMRVQADAA